MNPPLFIMPPIPLKPCPGSFGVARHKHYHTGVDLYTPAGSPVMAIEDGVVIGYDWFTGPKVKMPWWNDTRSIYIEGASGVFNYGEIMEVPLQKGSWVKAGAILGFVIPVLKKYKGRPTSMLHLELYDHGYKDDWGEWKLDTPKPEHLKDPTPYLVQLPNAKTTAVDDYWASSMVFGRLRESF